MLTFKETHHPPLISWEPVREYLGVIILLIFVIGFFFSPVILRDKTLFAPGDTLTAVQTSVPQLGDVSQQLYPWTYYSWEQMRQGSIPLWNPQVLAGTPHLANGQTGVLEAGKLLLYWLPLQFPVFWNLLLFSRFLLAGLFTYLYLGEWRVSRPARFFGAVGFMFCSFTLAWAGHAQAAASLWLPFLLWSIEGIVRKEQHRSSIFLSFGIMFLFFAGHIPIALQIMSFVCVYLALRLLGMLIANAQLSQIFSLLIRCLLFMAIGVMLAAPQLLPSLEYYLQSRQVAEVTRYRFGDDSPEEADLETAWEEARQVVSPFLAREQAENRWQGSERNYNQTGVYIGMIAFIFSIFGLWAVRRKKIGWFFMGAAIVGWGMAVPVRYFAVLNQLPVLELFAPYRWRLIVQFALIVLSVFGFDYLRRYMRRSRLFAGLAIGLLCLDLFAAHASYLPAQKAVDAADRHEILTYLMKHTGGSERVVWFGDNYSPNYAVLDGLSDVRGADSLFVSRYEALVKYYLHKDRDYYLMTKAADAFLDFYGVKYIVTTSAADFIERGGSVQTVIDVHADEAVGYQPVREDPLAVFENVDAAPRAYITHSWQPFGIRQTVDEEIAISGLDPTRVFIEERQNEDAIESRLATAQTGAVAVTPATIVRYDPDRVEIATNAAEPGLLVLSDTFYPGWEVTVDGVSQPVYAVDEAVRGTFVPAGIHEIIFIFRSRSFTIGIATCLVTIVVLIWLSLPSVQRHLRSLIWEVRYRIFDR